MEGILFQVLEYVGHSAYLSLAQSHRARQHQQSGPAAYRGLPCPPAGTVITTHTPQLACIIIVFHSCCWSQLPSSICIALGKKPTGNNSMLISHACMCFVHFPRSPTSVVILYCFFYYFIHTHAHTLYESLLKKNKFITNRFRHFKTKSE